MFRERPAIHRFPGAMAKRVRELAAHVAENYDGDGARVWTDAATADELLANLKALPGFGPMKVASLAAVLARRFGVTAAEPLVPSTRRWATSTRRRRWRSTRRASARTRRRCAPPPRAEGFG